MQQVISSGDVTSPVVTRKAKTIYTGFRERSIAISENADSQHNNNARMHKLTVGKLIYRMKK
jgi:hypothetical protein